jgi:hypothetical protein
MEGLITSSRARKMHSSNNLILPIAIPKQNAHTHAHGRYKHAQIDIAEIYIERVRVRYLSKLEDIVHDSD